MNKDMDHVHNKIYNVFNYKDKNDKEGDVT